jgi:hypothetical protein
MKAIFLPLLCLALLSSCGKKDEASAPVFTDQPVMQPLPSVPGAPPATGVAPVIQGQYPYVYVNYRVDEGSCSTGLRRFSGPEHWYVKRLMCDSFLNDSMNQRCGRAQRVAWFQQLCQ